MEIFTRLQFGKLQKLLVVCVLVLIVLPGCGASAATKEVRSLNGDALHEVWTQSVGGPINEPPLPVGDILVVASDQSPLVSLDIATGEKQWEYDPGVRIWDRAYGSDGERVYVGIDGSKFVALEAASGKILWEKELGINAQVPPLIEDGILYISTTFAGPGMLGNPDGKAKLFALDTDDGQILWEFESDNYILQTPYKLGDTIYLAGNFSDPKEVEEGGHMRLYALDALDRTVRWQYESEDGFTKRVYATENAVTYIAYRDYAVGVDAATGESLWRRDTGNWVPTLIGNEGVIYFGSANTVVHALDVDTGSPTWEFNIPEGTFNYVLGAPVIAAGEIVFLTQHGEVLSLDVNTGEMKWQYSTGIQAARTGLSISDGWLFIGDAQGVVHGYADH